MSDSAALERRYRRLLACYSRAFRREHEQEILSVLMAGASDGQRWPRLGEAVDLIRSAICIRLRPGASPSQPTVVFWAVRLLYVCAALRLLGVPLLPAKSQSSAYPFDIGISWGVFAWLAWANGRGHNWARVLFAVWVGLHSLALFYDVAHVSASSALGWALSASVVFWLVEFSALVLILSKPSSAHYRHKPVQS
jgi:hypothetical protein